MRGLYCRAARRAVVLLCALGSASTMAGAGAVSPAVPAAPDAPVAADLARHEAGVEMLRLLDGIPIDALTIPTLRDADTGMRIDGKVDEPVWAGIVPYDHMLVSIPATGKPGEHKTEARMFATERGLYVSAVMYQDPATLVTRMSVRDEFIDRDTFGVTLDTSGEGKFAYWFIIALGDTLMDGKVLPERNYSRDWDGPWIGKSARRADGWSAELFFPWSMMNLPAVVGPRRIGFAFSRQVSRENARYQWPGHAYSSAQFVSALNAMTVRDVQPLTQYSVIPFAATTADQRHDDTKLRLGADVSWKPSPKFEVSGTALPDFGSVEVDDVILNLTAQETFFPEKRLFFLEGSEVFETSGRANPGNQLRYANNENYATSSRRVFLNSLVPPPISLLNTRRIGGIASQLRVPAGVTAERGERALPTDLLGAVKVTGNTGAVRYGVLSAFEDDVSLLGHDAGGKKVNLRADGRDLAAVRLLYENVDSARRSIGYLGTLVRGPLYDAATNAIDGHYTSANGHLIAEGLLIATDVGHVRGNAAQFEMQYAPDSRTQHRITIDWFDKEVNFNDFGFLARNNYAGAQYALLYANSNTGGRVTDIRGTLIANAKVSVTEHHLVDGGVFWRNMMVLPGRNTLRSGIGYLPAGYEDRDSRGNGAYRTDGRVWSELLLATDASSRYSFSVNIGAQQENLGGWTYLIGGGVTWRPSDRVSMDLDLKYRDRHGWIVYQGGRNFGRFDAGDVQPAVKLNWFLAPAHQLNFTLQWAGVRADDRGFFAVPAGDGRLVPATRLRPTNDFTVSLLTMQARYRWEIAPLTDLYLVYNRGNTLPNAVDASFSDLFDDGIRHPIINSLVAKLRWRFGN